MLNKKYFIGIISALLFAALWTGCTAYDDYMKYVAGGEIIYPQKADSVKTFAGRNRVMLEWETLDPRVTGFNVIYEYAGQSDSLKVPAVHSEAYSVDVISCIIGGLEEAGYTFRIVSFDVAGNRSLVVEAAETAYGALYEKNLFNRTVKSKQMEENELKLEWYDAAASETGIELKYQTTDGTVKTVFTPSSENSSSLPDFDLDFPLSFRTLYKPTETSIDTFSAVTVEELITFPPQPQTAVTGHWEFDDANDLVKATVGSPLIKQGDGFTFVDGPIAGNGAVRVAQGSSFRALHGIAANGGSRVNNYTVMFDFKVSELGRYYSFIQTTLENNDDAEFFLRPAGNLGVGGTGYSAHVVTAGEWHRLVISAAMGNAYLYYLDGELIHTGNIENATVDSRWSWLPGGVLFFADEDGEDAEIDIAEVTVWDGALSAEDISALGKTPSSPAGEQLVGMWTFEDSNNLGKATAGNDLEASGSFTPIDGPGNTGAVKPASNAYYTIRHSIGANGGGSRVNEYTLMMDVRGSAAEFANWLSVFNTQSDNSGEGVLWIDGGGKIGYAALGGYSSSGLTPDTWHRVVIAAKLGESFRIYIDGEHAFSASSNTDADGKMSLHPDVVYIGADGTGYPGPSLADVRMWSIQLTDEQVRNLGKP